MKKLQNKYTFLDGRECILLDKVLLEKDEHPDDKRIIFTERNFNLYLPFPWKDQYVNIKQIISNKRTSITCENVPRKSIKLLDSKTIFLSQKVKNVPLSSIKCLLRHGKVVSKLQIHFENDIQVLVRQRRNTPINFEKSFYSANVKEDADLYTVILTLKVLGGSGNYVFSKAEDPKTDSIFRVDGKSGNVILLRKLNREDGAERFSIDVKAHDASDPSYSIVTPIKIKVIDVNDNSPVFDQVGYHMTVDEGQASNKYILTVKATDPDDGLNREILYSIVQKPNIKIPFQIDQKSGAIKNSEVLDRERTPYFNFTVKAEDQGVPKLSTTVMVSIILRDVNDNSPKFS
ncbi:MAG: cadherin repeat domain-containing protein, partial [Cyanobacteria bacterium J06649_11]